MRSSTSKTVAQGGNGRNGDWSFRPYNPHRKHKGGQKNNQMIISSDFAKGYQMCRVTDIHTNHKDGKVYGVVNGREVIRQGYAYSLTNHGHTPGQWVFV